MNDEQEKALSNLLVDIKRFKLSMEDGVENANSIENKFTETKNTIESILETDKDSREYKLFNNWYQGNTDLHWRVVPKPGSKAPTESKKITALQEILEKVLKSSTAKEISFNKDEEFQALNYLRKIVKDAKSKIVIIDSYLDDVVFDLIDGIDSQLNIYLLSHGKGNTGNIFKKMYLAYAKNNSNVQAKTNSSSHDRYLIIDDVKFFHLGASLNTIGKSDFMINEIETKEEQDRKLNDFNDWWKNGMPII